MKTAVNVLVKMFSYARCNGLDDETRHLVNCLRTKGWMGKKNRKLSDCVYTVATFSLAYANFIK